MILISKYHKNYPRFPIAVKVHSLTHCTSEREGKERYEK